MLLILDHYLKRLSIPQLFYHLGLFFILFGIILLFFTFQCETWYYFRRFLSRAIISFIGGFAWILVGLFANVIGGFFISHFGNNKGNDTK